MSDKQKNQTLSHKKLRAIHGEEYVKSFNKSDDGRISRLVNLMKLSENMIVVDFACGNGLLLSCIHKMIKYYYGVDFSENFIEEAKRLQNTRNIENAEFHCNEITDFCNNIEIKFDRAFSLDFSEHVYDRDFIEIARSIRKILKHNGIFYLHTPNKEFFIEILKDRGILRQFPEHIAVRTADEMVELLKEAGYRHINVSYLPHYLPILSYVDSFKFIPIVGKFARARLFIECVP